MNETKKRKLNRKTKNDIIRNMLLFCAVVTILVTPSVAKDSLVILDSKDASTMLQNVEYIESIGGNVRHRFIPNVLIADIPTDNNLVGQMNIIDIQTEIVDVPSVSKYGETVEIAANVWNNNYKKKSIESTSKDNIKKKLKPLDDMRFVPKDIRIGGLQTGSAPYGAGFYDTSEYMMGDVAVGIILPESNGATDPNTEDWTALEKSNVISEIQAGLDYWAVTEPRAKLTFTYDIHYNVATSYEPITHPYVFEGTWISETMNKLGYVTFSNYFNKVYEYDNYLRELLNTDWAYTIFVVDSSNDADGSFSDSYSAYAYLGGPFVVMTYDNDDYGIANMDFVAAHETGHTFYATDEYNGNTEYSGYLNAADIENSGKIMDCGVCWGISSGTALQLGWKDSDGDNIFDIIDFLPISKLAVYLPDPTTDTTPTYTGRSETTKLYPNNNPRSWTKHPVSINEIKTVQYRVDGGTWKNAKPKDGKFDRSIENFLFTTSPLSYATHKIEARAKNTAGNWDKPYPKDYLTIQP